MENIKHGDQWKNTLRDYAYPTIGNVPVSEVTKAQIVKALSSIWKTKAETASRVLQRIRTVFNYAAAKDYTKGMDAEFWQQVRMSLGSNEQARKVKHHSSCPYPLVGALLAAVKEGASSERSARLRIHNIDSCSLWRNSWSIVVRNRFGIP